jgi:hypothetical protein
MPANLPTFISSCHVLRACEKNAYKLCYRSTMLTPGRTVHGEDGSQSGDCQPVFRELLQSMLRDFDLKSDQKIKLAN